MLKTLVEKVDNIHEQMGNFSKEIESTKVSNANVVQKNQYQR